MSSATRHRATIDRLVRDERGTWLATLVFDDGRQLVLARDLLPPGARQHQVVLVSFEIDRDETERRAEEIRSLQEDLFGD